MIFDVSELSLRDALVVESMCEAGVHRGHLHVEGRRLVISGLTHGFSAAELAAIERFVESTVLRRTTPKISMHMGYFDPMFLRWEMILT